MNAKNYGIYDFISNNSNTFMRYVLKKCGAENTLPIPAIDSEAAFGIYKRFVNIATAGAGDQAQAGYDEAKKFRPDPPVEKKDALKEVGDLKE